jgi:flagellar assembly protein FliH
MALIRQANAATIARDALVLDLGDLKRQGDALRARAKAEADQIIAAARAERDRLLKQAAEEGRREGHARGLEEGRKQGRDEGIQAAHAERTQQLAALEQAWTAALDEFNSARGQMLIEAREDVLRLAVRMGEMIAKRAIDQSPDAAAQLTEALSIVSRFTRGAVLAHPDDLPLIQDALPAILQRFGSSTHLELTPDPSIERGGCILRTPSGGEVDATVQTQISRIVETLLPAHGPSEPGP